MASPARLRSQYDEIFIESNDQKRTVDIRKGVVSIDYYEDIFISNHIKDKWTKPESISDNINTLGHDAAIGLSADGEKLFLFKSSNKNVGDIYISFKNEKPYFKIAHSDARR